METTCKICGSIFKTFPHYKKKRGFYCSMKCYGISREGKPSWNKGKKTGIVPRTAFKKGQMPWCFKGGRVGSTGYYYVYAPNHPSAKGKYVPRSRIVMEKHLGRFLKPTEIVHHIDNNRLNDDIKNLKLFANSFFHKQHHAILNNPNK